MELDVKRRAAPRERALLDMYIAGVELRRGKMSAKEKDEIRYAWLAGFIAGQFQSDRGAK